MSRQEVCHDRGCAFAFAAKAGESITFERRATYPAYGVGVAVAKAKQLGVWEKLPHGLRQKIKSARGELEHSGHHRKVSGFDSG